MYSFSRKSTKSSYTLIICTDMSASPRSTKWYAPAIVLSIIFLSLDSWLECRIESKYWSKSFHISESFYRPIYFLTWSPICFKCSFMSLTPLKLNKFYATSSLNISANRTAHGSSSSIIWLILLLSSSIVSSSSPWFIPILCVGDLGLLGDPII